MPLVEERAYHFTLPSHWRAGARRGLRIHEDRLVVPGPLEIRPLLGTGTSDGNAAPAVDPRNRLLWLRQGTGQLVCWSSDDLPALNQGTLEDTVAVRRLLVTRSVIWVVADEGLHRYDSGTGQRLTDPSSEPGWQPYDAAGDEDDGLWIAESDQGHAWRLRHMNCWGQTCHEPIELREVTAEQLILVSDSRSDRVFALDPVESSDLIVVDLGARTFKNIGLDAVHGTGLTLIAAASEGGVHVLTVRDDSGRHRKESHYQLVDPISGSVEADQILRVPRELGRPTSLAGGAEKLLLAGSRGLAELVPVSTANEPRHATFITPALVSPLGARSGWDRADVEATLPAGSTMEISWAASNEVWLADWSNRILSDPSNAETFDMLDRRLPWESPGTVYRGDDGAASTYAALLNRAASTALWLRIDVRTAAGSTTPQLTGLAVHYPDTSYLDYLPAIYRSNQRSVEDLRQILAPYEVLLDGIDKMLDTLPERMNPADASDEWTDYLLGWLGFPPLHGLDAPFRRMLLASAAELLDARGTRAGLEKLLGLVTQERYTLTDSSEGPAGWFLGDTSVPSAGAGPSRLGVDTVVISQSPQPARVGAMLLGESSIGDTCADQQAMLAQRAGILTVTLHVGHDRPTLEPILDRLLDTFVPAHCRVRVVWTGPAETGSRRLDVDFRLAADKADDVHLGPADSLLHDEDSLRLGSSTRLGEWPLPKRRSHPPALDHGSHLGTELRLL